MDFVKKKKIKTIIIQNRLCPIERRKKCLRINKCEEFTFHMFQIVLSVNCSLILLYKWVLNVFYCSGMKWTVMKISLVDYRSEVGGFWENCAINWMRDLFYFIF